MFFCQAEDGIRDLVRSRGLGDVYKRQSVRFELLDLLRGFRSLVPHVRLSVLLAGPVSSDSAGTSRRCQGCFPPSPPFQGSGCPQLQHTRCDEHVAVSFHHRKGQWRLLAHQVGHPQTCLLYPSDAADERSSVDLGGRRILKKTNKKKNTRRCTTTNES